MRTTKDISATLKSILLNEESVRNIINKYRRWFYLFGLKVLKILG